MSCPNHKRPIETRLNSSHAYVNSPVNQKKTIDSCLGKFESKAKIRDLYRMNFKSGTSRNLAYASYSTFNPKTFDSRAVLLQGVILCVSWMILWGPISHDSIIRGPSRRVFMFTGSLNRTLLKVELRKR